MNDQQLKCFVTVAEKLNFTQAANELFLSTPTVTHHIKKLEEELHADLFIRTSKYVALTEAGITFYEHAKEILTKITLAEKNIQNIISSNVSYLRIGCNSPTELTQLEPCLASLKKHFPRVYPQIITHHYYNLKKRFANKQLDAFFTTKEITYDLEHCSFEKIKDISVYAIVPSSSLFSLKKEIQFEDLEEECLILLPQKFVPFQAGNKLQQKILLHSQSHFTLTCENDQTALLLTKSGYGIALLPEFFIPENLDSQLLAIPISSDEDCIEYGIAYRSDMEKDYLDFIVKNI